MQSMVGRVAALRLDRQLMLHGTQNVHAFTCIPVSSVSRSKPGIPTNKFFESAHEIMKINPAA
jgi:hypothetical protein